MSSLARGYQNEPKNRVVLFAIALCVTDLVGDDRYERQRSRCQSDYSGEARLHAALGSLYGTAARVEEAERELLQAVALAPGNAHYHVLLGRLYSSTKKHDLAEAQFM